MACLSHDKSMLENLSQTSALHWVDVDASPEIYISIETLTNLLMLLLFIRSVWHWMGSNRQPGDKKRFYEKFIRKFIVIFYERRSIKDSHTLIADKFHSCCMSARFYRAIINSWLFIGEHSKLLYLAVPVKGSLEKLEAKSKDYS